MRQSTFRTRENQQGGASPFLWPSPPDERANAVYETPTMQQIDALLLELDSVAYGPGRKPQIQALSDALAQAWEAHRGEVLRPERVVLNIVEGRRRLIASPPPIYPTEVKPCQRTSNLRL